MQVIEYNGYNTAKLDVEICCALGFFDGVHVGHRHLIRECISTAKKEKLVPAVFTFPAETMDLKGGKGRIYSTEDKIEIFRECGVELLVLCNFSSVRELTPEQFVSDVLCGDLNCRVALTGEGFRFGKGAAGTPEILSQLLTENGAKAITVEDVKIDGVTVSSTEIRRALYDGQPEYAARLLGEPYFIRGKVRHGRGVGRVYGFPTVNTELRDKTALKVGVYKSCLTIDGKVYTGLTNIGTCPTFDRREIHAETMILNFSGDLYGENLKINLLKFIRFERKFDTPEDLRAQIDKDILELE